MPIDVVNVDYYGTNEMVFDIRNTDSKISDFYQIKTPYQITYEVCSGGSDADYLNIVTLFGNESHYSKESFRGHDYVYRNHPEHFHDYFEFMIVLEGAVTQRIEGNEYRYPAGSCCLVNRGLCHKEGFDQSARLLFLGFSVDFLKELFSYMETSVFREERDIKKSPMYHFLLEDMAHPGKKTYLDFIATWQNRDPYRHLHETVTYLLDTLMFPHFGSEYIAKGLLCEILYHLGAEENYHHTKIEVSMRNDNLLFSRIAHLMEERNGRISRAELSSGLNYSGDYIGRIVKKYSGMSLQEYGMTFCLKAAAERLLHTDRPITEIASDLGFTNRSFFYKLFRKQYGVTPKEYRERHSQ